MSSRFSVLFFLLLLAIPSISEAQRRPLGPMVTPRRGIPLYYEAVALFKPDTATVTINVHFRVPREFFVYVRNEGGPADSAFVATGEIVVELLDSQSTAVSRDLRFLRMYRRDPLTEGSPGGEIIGMSHFDVKPGTYRLAFSIDDKQSERTFADRSRMIAAQALTPEALNVSKPILFPLGAFGAGGLERASALNYGGDFLFGMKGGLAVVQIFLPDSVPDLRVRWTLVNKAPLFGIDSTQFSGDSLLVIPGRLVADSAPDSVVYKLEPAESGWYVLELPIPLGRLFEGRCDVRLKVSSGVSSKDVAEDFRIVWPSKPGSLIDLDLAIDALQHIASESQMESMRSMSLSSRTSAFFSFWHAMDPDTTTAYNEKFAEYYRRVDIAMERFRGPKDAEGYRTDQGRIFILYGIPTSSQRIFAPDDAPQEIWIYENLKQRFIFTDKFGTGVFILTGVEQL